ncbi:hypothetical protein HNQ02_002988 [Flavobacterium sp. 7E]|nr:hypothetical protein [Flavobacterium sp. 7E]
MENSKKTYSIFCSFLMLQLMKYILLLIFIYTDNNFYVGEINNSNYIDLNLKNIYVNLIPLIIYSSIFLIFILKKRVKLFEGVLIYSITMLLNHFFDLRDILYFINNHRVKVCVALFLITILFIKFTRFRKKINSVPALRRVL